MRRNTYFSPQSLGFKEAKTLPKATYSPRRQSQASAGLSAHSWYFSPSRHSVLLLGGGTALVSGSCPTQPEPQSGRCPARVPVEEGEARAQLCRVRRTEPAGGLSID